MTDKQKEEAIKVVDHFGSMLIDTFGKERIQHTEYKKETRQITLYCKDGTVHRIAIQQIN